MVWGPNTQKDNLKKKQDLHNGEKEVRNFVTPYKKVHLYNWKDLHVNDSVYCSSYLLKSCPKIKSHTCFNKKRTTSK